MAKRRDSYFDPDAPPWARYNGESYVFSFSGTAKQKWESEKLLAELLAGRHKRKKHRRSSSKR